MCSNDLRACWTSAELDWERILSLCVDPERARRYRQSLPPNGDPNLCSMCGQFCAIKRSNAVKNA